MPKRKRKHEQDKAARRAERQAYVEGWKQVELVGRRLQEEDAWSSFLYGDEGVSSPS